MESALSDIDNDIICIILNFVANYSSILRFLVTCKHYYSFRNTIAIYKWLDKPFYGGIYATLRVHYQLNILPLSNVLYNHKKTRITVHTTTHYIYEYNRWYEKNFDFSDFITFGKVISYIRSMFNTDDLKFLKYTHTTYSLSSKKNVMNAMVKFKQIDLNDINLYNELCDHNSLICFDIFIKLDDIIYSMTEYLKEDFGFLKSTKYSRIAFPWEISS